MNRIHKYKESLYKFIKDESCLNLGQNMQSDQANQANQMNQVNQANQANQVNQVNQANQSNQANQTNQANQANQTNQANKINQTIYDMIKSNDLIFSILLLTILNNQNKKSHICMQGYYFATSIQFLTVYVDLINLKEKPADYAILLTKLLTLTSKSIEQNMESIKSIYKADDYATIMLSVISVYNNILMNINNLHNFNFVVDAICCNSDISKWYLNHDAGLNDKYLKYKKIKLESMNLFIDLKYRTVCELSMVIGWIVGCGSMKEINKIKMAARSFGIMYKIAKDFENLDSDLKNNQAGAHVNNYVLNYGLQDSYEMFLDNKQIFIEKMMLLEIYTNTIKEIIDLIEENVDVIIDQTSPDLKSNYSSKKTK